MRIEGKRTLGQRIMEEETLGDGVAWWRGEILGKGSSGSVYLARLKKGRSKYSCFPSLMAVKSAEVSVSGSIQKEREVLSNISDCRDIIRCFGEETTRGMNGTMVYNLLLEYGSGGTLANRIEKSGLKGLPESEVKCYTRSILRGLSFIHEKGYVHCDLKPDNILLVPITGGKFEFRAKIGDFGLAKRDKLSKKRKIEPYCRGTLMYLSPETVVDGVQNAPSDIWALGCMVLEMMTGKPPWDPNDELSADDVLKKIGDGMELPEIPNELSKEAKDFLKRCFVRKSMFRLTAEMLLNHAFLEGLSDEYEEVEEVDNFNSVDTILLVSESEDGWDFGSEDESWSEEDDDVGMESEFSSPFYSQQHLKAEKGDISPRGGAGCDHAIQPSLQVPSQISLNITQRHPLNFTISADV